MPLFLCRLVAWSPGKPGAPLGSSSDSVASSLPSASRSLAPLFQREVDHSHGETPGEGTQSVQKNGYRFSLRNRLTSLQPPRTRGPRRRKTRCSCLTCSFPPDGFHFVSGLILGRLASPPGRAPRTEGLVHPLCTHIAESDGLWAENISVP